MAIETYLNMGETVLWKGKPKKGVFIKEQIFSPLLPFALLWLIVDSTIISIFIFGDGVTVNFPSLLLIPFFILHLLPVWLYLGKVIFALKRWSNTEYMVTDKAVYALSGVFTTTCQRKTFQEITNISIHQGIIDKHNNVGDVFIVTGFNTTSDGKMRTTGINIVDIEDYIRVYKLISQTGQDIFSDTMYPNDLRPKENHGYRTEYTPDDK